MLLEWKIRLKNTAKETINWFLLEINMNVGSKKKRDVKRQRERSET